MPQPLDPRQIAEDAIGLYLEFLSYGHDEENARALAVREVVDGCAVDLEEIERQMAAEFVPSAPAAADLPL